MPLSSTAVRNAKPGEKARKMFDGGGLYVEVAPRGGKWWRFKYRINGKEKRISLGTYPDVSLKDARERRDEARKLVANNIDPSEQRKAEKAASVERTKNSFEAVAREWFSEHSRNWCTGHADRIIRGLEKDVFPWIGSDVVADITPRQLLETVRRVKQRGALKTAHQVLNTCGRVFRYAVVTGRAEYNPSDSLRGALPPVKGKHFASVTEPKKVGKILQVLDGYEGTLIVRCALRFAPLVFVRSGELCRAQWEDINLDEAEWRYLVTKTQTQHIVPLSRQAVRILQELRPLTGKGRYVFPSGRNPKGDRPVRSGTILAAMRRMGISEDESTVHGFRATARTILDEVLGYRPEYIEHQLAHRVRDPNGRAYNRTAHLPERKEMMQAWADYLDELKAGVEDTPISQSS